MTDQEVEARALFLMRILFEVLANVRCIARKLGITEEEVTADFIAWRDQELQKKTPDREHGHEG